MQLSDIKQLSVIMLAEYLQVSIEESDQVCLCLVIEDVTERLNSGDPLILGN